MARGCITSVFALVCLAVAGVAVAQAPRPEDDPLKVLVFTFEHQSSEDALGEIRPLFSDQGTLELGPSQDTVVLRDHSGELESILRALRDFDHPRQQIRLEVQLLKAYRAPFSPIRLADGVSKELVSRLSSMLRYDGYESLSEAGFLSREGEEVAYDFGDDLSLDFRIGTIVQQDRLALKEFRVRRPSDSGEWVAVLRANLVLRLGQTLALVLLRDETAASAIVIAVTCHRVASQGE